MVSYQLVQVDEYDFTESADRLVALVCELQLSFSGVPIDNTSQADSQLHGVLSATAWRQCRLLRPANALLAKSTPLPHSLPTSRQVYRLH